MKQFDCVLRERERERMAQSMPENWEKNLQTRSSLRSIPQSLSNFNQ